MRKIFDTVCITSLVGLAAAMLWPFFAPPPKTEQTVRRERQRIAVAWRAEVDAALHALTNGDEGATTELVRLSLQNASDPRSIMTIGRELLRAGSERGYAIVRRAALNSQKPIQESEILFFAQQAAKRRDMAALEQVIAARFGTPDVRDGLKRAEAVSRARGRAGDAKAWNQLRRVLDSTAGSEPSTGPKPGRA
ncbi:MAG: hypothetical protein SFX74_10770 [Fimbriimonadaceae bacterium]|nr:hypothetical protein [Fimbriimonadaceae bacterium]